MLQAELFATISIIANLLIASWIVYTTIQHFKSASLGLEGALWGLYHRGQMHPLADTPEMVCGAWAAFEPLNRRNLIAGSLAVALVCLPFGWFLVALAVLGRAVVLLIIRHAVDKLHSKDPLASQIAIIRAKLFERISFLEPF